MMQIVVGLGNPGSEYAQSRHNAGFMAVEEWRKNVGKGDWVFKPKFKANVCETGKLLLVQPLTFMNRSGETVGSICRFYKVPSEKVLVFHDDLDIVLGEGKLVFGKGPKVHNGITSVEAAIGKEFWRGRMGVDNRTLEERRAILGERYVLRPMTHDERGLLITAAEQLIRQAQELCR